MLKKIIHLPAVAIIFFLAVLQTGKAQSPQQIISEIYKSYDNLKFLTFDVRFTYSGDTLSGNASQDLLEGTYTMAGKKAKYNLGAIDFMQNDSFFIAVYNNDKVIIVSDPRTSDATSELPMRQTMDSLVQAYAQHYRVVVSAVDEETGKINFAKADSMAQFNNFSITYNLKSKLLNAIEYSFNELEEEDGDNERMPVVKQKKLTVEFLNYRADNFSESLYSENNYIWFEDGECKPVDKYKDFKVYYSRANPQPDTR